MDIASEKYNVSNARRVLDLKAGLTVSASAASIAFLWTHWHLLYELEGGGVRMESVGEGAWCGKGYGGKGEWYLSSASYDAWKGRFEFYSWVRFKGVVSRGLSIFEYRRVDDEYISYWGHAWGELPPLLGWMKPVLEGRAKRVMVGLNNIGGRAAERISRQPNLIDEIASPEALKIWQEMREDEASQLDGETRSLRQFQVQDELSTEQQRLRDLIADGEIIAALMGEDAPHVLRELDKAIGVFEVDPTMGVGKLRQMLEPIIQDVFFSYLKRRPTHAEMAMKQLNAIRDQLPASVYTAMKTVVTLGNIGIHVPGGSVPSKIDFLEFRTSFDALLVAMNWYYRPR